MDDFRSLSFVEYAKFVGRKRKRIAVSNATITTTTRTPPSIGFASSENLFSYVRLPVSKSVESIAHCVVSEMCRENERTKRERSNPIDLRARLLLRRSKKRVRRTFRAFRDVWVVLRHGAGGAFFFVCVRSSVSLSVSKKEFRCQRKRLDSRER